MDGARVDARHRVQKITKACDACRRKKIKCNWRPPTCADCLRLGIPCTFSNNTRAFNRHIVEAAPATHDRLRTVPATLNVQPPVPSSFALLEASKSIPAPHGNGKALVYDGGFGAVFDQYLHSVNHYIPIFHPKRLRNQLFDGTCAKTANEPLNLVCGNAMIACLGASQSCSGGAARDMDTEDALQRAASAINADFLSNETLFALQVVLVIVLALEFLQSKNKLAGNLRAVAARMALSLSLHRLNDVDDISFEDRLEKLQVFWCTHVLDVEAAIRDHSPPSVPEDEIDGILIEPPKFPHNGYGIVESTGGITLNLFTSRQRLARIASLAWRQLYARRVRIQAISVRTRTIARLNQMLQEWKSEWFDHGAVNDLEKHWPNEAVACIVELQFSYFLCLLKVNEMITKPISDPTNVLEPSCPIADLPSQCFDAARDAMGLAAVVHKSRDALMRATQCVVPAIVVLLAAKVTDAQTRDVDMRMVRHWLDVLSDLAHSSGDQGLQRAHATCEYRWSNATKG